jgi:hypothetical protein
VRRILWEVAQPLDYRTLLFRVSAPDEPGVRLVKCPGIATFTQCYRGLVALEPRTDIQSECHNVEHCCNCEDAIERARARIREMPPVSLQIEPEQIPDAKSQ